MSVVDEKKVIEKAIASFKLKRDYAEYVEGIAISAALVGVDLNSISTQTHERELPEIDY